MTLDNENPPAQEHRGAEEIGATDFASNLVPAPDAGKSYSLVERNTEAAAAFLESWTPGGPWVLTAIKPDGPGIETATFDAANVDAMRDWIDRFQGKWNIYFTVNPTVKALNSKAKKTDIRGMKALHVDVDPRVGEKLEDERERALKVLRAFTPPPTVILDSGGGFQGFWLLDSEHETNGSESRIAELEAYNLDIETKLQGDSCHNIDRIMRLPGTVNLPDEKKRKKGRGKSVASVVEADWSRVYRLDQFTPAPTGNWQGTTAGPTVNLPAELPKLVSLDDLPAAVKDRTKALIVQGDDPDDPTKYPSRSEALFAVVCDLVRAGCTDEQMAAVILDPDYGISESVLENSRPRQYAERQIRRAHEEAVAPELRELNDRHAILTCEGGKTRVMDEYLDLQGRRVYALQTFDDFRDRYMRRQVKVGRDKAGGDVMMPLGKWWLQNENAREYHSLVFAPGRDPVVGDKLNLWKGWAVAPKQGDWSLMEAHIRKVLASGDATAADYILDWSAFAVQHPAEPAEVALVFRGGKGTGKGVFARALMNMFGQHGFQIDSTMSLTGRFNLHLRDCCLLFADEVEWSGDRQAEARLKRMITEPTLHIEGKGTNSISATNHLHIVMASNEDWVVPASIDERRFAAFAVSDAHVGDEAYWTALHAQMENGGLEAMLFDLLHRDIGKWHPRRNIPQTGELMAQKIASLSGAAAVVLELLRRGETPYVEREGFGRGRVPRLENDDKTVGVFLPTGDVAAWALAKRLVSEAKGLTESLGHELLKAGGESGRQSVQGKQVRGFWMPALPVARQTWSEARKLVIGWGEGDEAAWDVASDSVASDDDAPF